MDDVVGFPDDLDYNNNIKPRTDPRKQPDESDRRNHRTGCHGTKFVIRFRELDYSKRI